MKNNDNLRYAHLLWAQNELKEKINEVQIHWDLDKKYFQEKIKHSRGIKREAWKEIYAERAEREISRIENMKKDLLNMEKETHEVKMRLIEKEIDEAINEYTKKNQEKEKQNA